MTRGYLVSEDWAKRVDAAIKENASSELDKSQSFASLFYDVRPAVLASLWAQNGAGLWVATANFLVNDVLDSSFTFNVCAPASTANPGGTVGSTRFYVVWRGRWEMIAGAGGGGSSGTPQTATFMTTCTFSVDANGYLVVTFGTATINYLEPTP